MTFQLIHGRFYCCADPWRQHFDFRENDVWAWFVAWEAWMESRVRGQAWWVEMHVIDRINLFHVFDANQRPAAWKRVVLYAAEAWNRAVDLLRKVTATDGVDRSAQQPD